MLGGFARRWFKEPRYPGPRICMTCDFEWHYAVSQDDEYEEALARLRQGVSKSDFVVRAPVQRTATLEPQPVWNLLEPPIHRELMEPTMELTMVQPEAIYSEVWACYRPFHYADRPAGISLWADGVASCADALRDAVHTLGGTLTDRAAVVWAMSLLYLHELVHQIVEDVVTALEFRIEEELYRPAQAKWSGYLLMEEALANSFVRSLQSKFLAMPRTHAGYEARRAHQAQYDKKPYTPEPEPIIDAPLMIRALDSIMRTQPAGYRDYVDFGSNIEQLFYDNLFCLVMSLYLPHHGRVFHKYEHELRMVLDAGGLREGWRAWWHDDVVHWRR